MAESMWEMELQAQQDALDERRELLKQRAAAAARQIGLYAPGGGVDVTQPQGFRSAVTGADIIAPMVKRPALAALAPLIAETRDAYDRDKLTGDQAAYRQREQADALAQIEAMPRATPAVPAVTPLTPNDDEGNPMPSFPAVPAKEPSLRDTILWAQRASANPSLKGVMGQLIADRVVKEPERAEARDERKLTRETTIAEARRKQAEDLAYKRERDEQAAQLRRDLADQQGQLRRDLHAAIKASGGGSGDDKASNYKTETAPDGTVVYRNLVTGKVIPGGQGHQDPSFVKDNLNRKETIDNANEGLRTIASIRKVLPQASSSVYEAGKGWVASKFNYTTDVAKANSELETLSGNLTSMIPRMAGAVSDADLRFLAQQAADAANDKKPVGARMAALQRAEERLNAILKNTAPPVSKPNTAVAPSGNVPSVRDSVKDAIRQQQGGWSVEKVN